MIQEVNQLVDIKVGGFATTPDRKRNDQLTVIHFGLKRYLMPHCRLGSHSMVPHLSTKMAIVQTPQHPGMSMFTLMQKAWCPTTFL